MQKCFIFDSKNICGGMKHSLSHKLCLLKVLSNIQISDVKLMSYYRNFFCTSVILSMMLADFELPTDTVASQFFLRSAVVIQLRFDQGSRMSRIVVLLALAVLATTGEEEAEKRYII